MRSNTYAIGREDAERSFMQNTYAWMAAGLALTALVATWVAGNRELLLSIVSNRPLFFGLLIGEVVLVLILSWGINKLSAAAATLMFAAYAAINGLTLAVVFLVYTTASIAATFFVTAGMFAATSIYGYVTKKDLSSMGSFLFMALVGLIIALCVNMFLRSTMFDLAISCVGVIVFVLLTAYDTQKIKALSRSGIAFGGEEAQKASIIGALALYLDFVNLFLYLLRFLGKKN